MVLVDFSKEEVYLRIVNYLEELTDKPYEESISTQTDTYLDKPTIPIFIPTSSGEDKETQVYDGELFEFNLEVEPILEVLVGKAIDQSLIEVIEEQGMFYHLFYQKIFFKFHDIYYNLYTYHF